MVCVLDKMLKVHAFDERTVFLFGHCNATEEMVDYLLAKGIVSVGILDNSVSKQGLRYRDVPIFPPETIQSYDAENSIVLIATRFFAEMHSQLKRLGYDGEIVRVVEYDSFTEFSLLDETIERMETRMLRGAETLAYLRSGFPTQHFVVCPNNALGDVYWAMAFLPSYCNKNMIAETLVIVVGDGCRDVAELFGLEDAIVLDQTEMDEFVQALIYKREENCIIAHHDRPYTDNIIKYLDKRFLSFIDYYRCAVYGLPRYVEPVAPTAKRTLVGTTPLVEDNSVIISPYANSVTQPADSFWARIVDEWSGKGYHVFTSTYGSEQPVCGTTPISLPIDQLIPAVEYAGVFIGLRNGICDIVNTARCRKIVVFPDCYYSSTPHKVKDFFELPGWERIIV